MDLAQGPVSRKLLSRIVLFWRIHASAGFRWRYNARRPAAEAEEGKKKSEEEVKAEQEALSKDQTAALKKGLAQITVSANDLQSVLHESLPTPCSHGTLR